MKIKRIVQQALLTLLVILQTNLAFGQSNDRWYVSEIAGSRVGYAFESSKPVGEQIVSETEMKMVLNRLGSKTEMFARTKTTESQSGNMIRMEFELKFSEKATRTTIEVADHSLISTSTIGGKDYKKTIDFEGVVLGPEGIRKKSIAELREVGNSMKYQTFVPLFGSTPVKARRTFLVREEITLNGNAINAIVIEERIGMMPGSKLWLDEDFRWIKTEADSPFGKSATFLADRAQALGAAEGSILPPEIFERTMIRSNVRFPFTSPVESMDVELTLTNPELEWPELASENQQVLSQDKMKTVLRVTRPSQSQTTKADRSGDVDSLYLKPSGIMNSDNEDIVRISNEVASLHSSDWDKCMALKDWVSENVDGDPGVVLASASEIIKNRRGTCSAFATLLCSMIRAAGIPCRYSQGLVYMNGIWGGHAWVEAWIGDRWIPLDAAINNFGAANAARLQFLHTPLDQGIGQINGAIGNRLYGNIEIKVLAYTVAGENIPASTSPFQVSETSYRNSGIGVNVKKESPFEFAGMKDVYPKNSIVTLCGPDDEKIVVRQMLIPAECDPSIWIAKQMKKLAGKQSKIEQQDVFGSRSTVASSTNKFVVTRRQGQQLLVVEVQSENPSKLFGKVQSWFSFTK